MFEDFDRIVLAAGGRFYFAKNSDTTPETARRFLGGETIGHFQALKHRTDPDNLLQSDLYRRIFQPGPATARPPRSRKGRTRRRRSEMQITCPIAVRPD